MVRLAQANLASQNYFANFVKKADFDDKLKKIIKRITPNKTKHVLVEKEFKNYRHLTQVFLSIKVTLTMMEHNFSQSFNHFIIL